MRGFAFGPNDDLVGISRNLSFADESDLGFVLLGADAFLDAGKRVETGYMGNFPTFGQLTTDNSRKPVVGSNDVEVGLIDRSIFDYGGGEFGQKCRKSLFSLVQLADRQVR